MDLDSLKYSELQKLAKSVGIKANQKMDKLTKALGEYYSSQEANGNKERSTPLSPRDTSKTEADGVDSCETGTPCSMGSGVKTRKRRSTFEKEAPYPQANSPAPQTANERKRRSTFEKEGPSVTVETGTPQQGKGRKRHSTYEIDEASLGAPATPEVDKSISKTTSDSDESVFKATGDGSSPSVQTMLDSMSGEISSAERKKRLMEVIDKKVEEKMKNSPHVASTTQIPRFAAFLAQRKKEQKKPVTPGNKDWKKVHKKAFSKFDSIDVYLEKKRKRTEDLTASMKKARTVLHEVQEAVTKLKSRRTPSLGKTQAEAKPFKPTVMSTKNISFNFAASQKPKTPSSRSSTQPASDQPFKPTVMSTKDINLNFGSLRTPGEGASVKAFTKQQSPHGTGRAISNQHPKNSAGAGDVFVRKSLKGALVRKSTTTPFKFTGALNTFHSQANSASKPAFDLKASLACPITWKPHTGKLKPMEFNLYDGGAAVDKSASKISGHRHLDLYKTQRTRGRNGRRAAVAASRTDKKGKLEMRRRGISVVP